MMFWVMKATLNVIMTVLFRAGFSFRILLYEADWRELILSQVSSIAWYAKLILLLSVLAEIPYRERIIISPPPLGYFFRFPFQCPFKKMIKTVIILFVVVATQFCIWKLWMLVPSRAEQLLNVPCYSTKKIVPWPYLHFERKIQKLMIR